MEPYNPKKDYLKEDPVIAGQTYAVVSFVNPKDEVEGKLLYYINNFTVLDINKMITAQAIQMVRKLSVDMRNKIADQLDRLKFSRDEEDKHISRILEKKFRAMVIDEDEYVEECRREYSLDETEITDKYKIFLAENRARLDTEYDNAHDGVNSLRGFKVRGNYATLVEARERAQYLRDNVEPAIHTFTVPVGFWFPVDMEADEVQEQEYMSGKLNELMYKYHANTQARNASYNDRKDGLQHISADSNRRNTKARLQEKLKRRRNEKIQKEIKEYKNLGLDNDAKKTKKPKKPVEQSTD